MTRPAYMSRETLARTLEMAVGAIDQLVKRGLLPPPVMIGEAPRWKWDDVDKWIAGTRTEGLGNVADTTDPYMAGADRAAKAAAPRRVRPQQDRPPVLLPAPLQGDGAGSEADSAAGPAR